MALVPFDTMQHAIAKALVHAGMKDSDARECARIHTESTCDGVNSHGANRVARFVDYLGKGWVVPDAKPELVKQLSAIEVYDGNRGPGILNALFATERAIRISKDHGIGIVALRNTAHWMRGGTYGWHAADRGCIMIGWTNTESCMPAWGAKDTRIGNNPFVIAVPRKKGHLVLDMAMSQFSYGKLQATQLKGQTMPFPAGFDRQGNLTANPGLVEETRRILPMGYWKGSGFAIMLDVLAAVLSEGTPTNAIDKIQEGSGTGCSQIFLVVDPARLGGEAYTEDIADSVVASVHASVPAEHSKEILYPGENTLKTRIAQRENGIAVDDGVWDTILALADEKS